MSQEKFLKHQKGLNCEESAVTTRKSKHTHQECFSLIHKVGKEKEKKNVANVNFEDLKS